LDLLPFVGEMEWRNNDGEMCHVYHLCKYTTTSHEPHNSFVAGISCFCREQTNVLFPRFTPGLLYMLARVRFRRPCGLACVSHYQYQFICGRSAFPCRCVALDAGRKIIARSISSEIHLHRMRAYIVYDNEGFIAFGFPSYYLMCFLLVVNRFRTNVCMNE